MEKLGGSGRGALWYGSEVSVLHGRMTAGEELPEHERTDAPFQQRPSSKDPLRYRGTVRTKDRLRDPLAAAHNPDELERQWTLANGIYVED
jgi:hypothetical protein